MHFCPKQQQFCKHVPVLFLTLPWPKLTPPTPHNSCFISPRQNLHLLISQTSVPLPLNFFSYIFMTSKHTIHMKIYTKSKKGLFANIATQPKVALSQVCSFIDFCVCTLTCQCHTWTLSFWNLKFIPVDCKTATDAAFQQEQHHF